MKTTAAKTCLFAAALTFGAVAAVALCFTPVPLLGAAFSLSYCGLLSRCRHHDCHRRDSLDAMPG